MAPVIRIVLRYLSGFLVAKGWLSAEYDLASDPDVILVAGLIVGAATEVAYLIARKLGWAR